LVIGAGLFRPGGFRGERGICRLIVIAEIAATRQAAEQNGNQKNLEQFHIEYFDTREASLFRPGNLTANGRHGKRHANGAEEDEARVLRFIYEFPGVGCFYPIRHRESDLI
jgi:hypothetical protein